MGKPFVWLADEVTRAPYESSGMSDAKEKIVQAFTDSPHRWRTARSIAQETGISIADVTRILERSPEIKRAKSSNSRGEALYARKQKRVVDAPESDAQRHNSSTLKESSQSRFKFLVLLPFDRSTSQLRDVINNTVRQNHGQPLFLDEMVRPGAVWVEELSQLVRTSGAVIADISYPSISLTNFPRTNRFLFCQKLGRRNTN